MRVYDNPEKYECLDVPARAENSAVLQEASFSAAARFLTACSAPAVYEGAGVCGAAFGGDAHTLPAAAFEKGLILDADAALILQRGGVDTGILSCGETPAPAGWEFFIKEGYAVGHADGVLARVLRLRPGARTLSEGETQTGERFPLSYTYVNARGQRFLVYAFESLFASQSWMRCYLRQGQVAAFAAAAGEPLPAFCPGCPELYILAKRRGTSIAVGLWNLFPDPIKAPRVKMPSEVKSVKGLRSRAHAQGDEVLLDGIPAYGYAFFEARL